jgi:hypothetical protein
MADMQRDAQRIAAHCFCMLERSANAKKISTRSVALYFTCCVAKVNRSLIEDGRFVFVNGSWHIKNWSSK